MFHTPTRSETPSKTLRKREREKELQGKERHQKRDFRREVRFIGLQDEESDNPELDNSIEKLNIDEHIYQKLRKSFTQSKDCFDGFLAMYLRYKRLEASLKGNMFVAPICIFELAERVFSSTHQFFTNPVIQSGFLKYHSSEDSMDGKFGACGSWEQVEGCVQSGVGFLCDDPVLISKVLSTFDKNICGQRPYCRVLLLPTHEGSTFRKYEETRGSAFAGEMLIEFSPFQIIFQHQQEFYYARESEEKRRKYDCDKPFGVLVWVNEAFLNLHPPASDIEECLLSWALRWFDDEDIINLNSVSTLFPSRSRSGLYSADNSH